MSDEYVPTDEDMIPLEDFDSYPTDAEMDEMYFDHLMEDARDIELELKAGRRLDDVDR